MLEIKNLQTMHTYVPRINIPDLYRSKSLIKSLDNILESGHPPICENLQLHRS
jgi:hypothetical protein